MSGGQRPKTKTDELSLLRRVAQGEGAAVACLYQTYVDTVFRFVYRRVGNQHEDAEEITQDTFQSAVKLAATFHGLSSVATWLCGIAKLRLASFYRQRNRLKRIPSELVVSLDSGPMDDLLEFDSSGPPIDELLDRLDAVRIAHLTLGALDDDEREVMLMRYADELSVREIAQLMNRTEKSVEHLLARARKNAARAGAVLLQEAVRHSVASG